MRQVSLLRRRWRDKRGGRQARPCAVDATRDARLATVPQAVVRQRGNALVVETFGAGGLSPAAKTVVSARVLVALRELDDYHRVIDTVFYD